jgi:hypothetical protein
MDALPEGLPVDQRHTLPIQGGADPIFAFAKIH